MSECFGETYRNLVLWFIRPFVACGHNELCPYLRVFAIMFMAKCYTPELRMGTIWRATVLQENTFCALKGILS